MMELMAAAALQKARKVKSDARFGIRVWMKQQLWNEATERIERICYL